MHEQILQDRDFLTDPRIPVAVSMHIVDSQLAVHRHTFLELFVVADGEAVHLHGNRRYVIGAGDVVAIDRGVTHSFSVNAPLRLYNILLDDQALLQIFPDLRRLRSLSTLLHLDPLSRKRMAELGLLRLRGQSIQDVESLLRHMIRELDARDDGYVLKTGGLFAALITDLSRTLGRTSAPLLPAIPSRLESVRISIEQEHQRQWNNDELAERAHMSNSAFRRNFGAAIGMAPQRYLKQVRLRHAMRLLADSDETVDAIARAVGFRDGNYFARVFKAETGTTPREWRAN